MNFQWTQGILQIEWTCGILLSLSLSLSLSLYLNEHKAYFWLKISKCFQSSTISEFRELGSCTVVLWREYESRLNWWILSCCAACSFSANTGAVLCMWWPHWAWTWLWVRDEGTADQGISFFVLCCSAVHTSCAAVHASRLCSAWAPGLLIRCPVDQVRHFSSGQTDRTPRRASVNSGSARCSSKIWAACPAHSTHHSEWGFTACGGVAWDGWDERAARWWPGWAHTWWVWAHLMSGRTRQHSER